jgi:hypothetical protein
MSNAKATQTDCGPVTDLVTDQEIARRWHMSADAERSFIASIEKSAAHGYGPSFPARQKNGMRSWSDIEAFLGARYNVSVGAPKMVDGEEQWPDQVHVAK